MSQRRRVPQHVIGCVAEGRRHNARIRDLIRKLADSKERDIAIIYIQLNLIVLETLGSDNEWSLIEQGTREQVRADNERSEGQ